MSRTEFITSRAAMKEILACQGCCTGGESKSVHLQKDEVLIRQPGTASKLSWGMRVHSSKPGSSGRMTLRGCSREAGQLRPWLMNRCFTPSLDRRPGRVERGQAASE